MLRCIKWLPIACIGLFALFCLIGYKLVPNKPVAIPTIEDNKMELTFQAFDIHAKPIQARSLDSNGHPFPKLGEEWKKGTRGPLVTVEMKPDDSAHYSGLPELVQWRTKEEFRKWLDSDFKQVLLSRKANLNEWKSELSELDADANDISCIYPIILYRK
jgi:hypothetical protein